VLPVTSVMNLRHEQAKSEGWKDKPPSQEAFIQAVVAENNLLRRPILLQGKKAQVGWDEAAIRALFSPGG
jgi:arsenate reductase-like glutaredoxin family protein